MNLRGHTSTLTHKRSQARKLIITQIHTRIHKNKYIHSYIKHTHMYTQTHASGYVHVRECVRVDMYVRVLYCVFR